MFPFWLKMVLRDSGCVVIHPELLCFSLGCKISYFQCHNKEGGGGIVFLNSNPDLQKTFLKQLFNRREINGPIFKKYYINLWIRLLYKLKPICWKLSFEYGLIFKTFPNNFSCVYFDSKYIFGASLIRICIAIWTIKLKWENNGIFHMFLYNNM